MVISNVGPFLVGAGQATENRVLYDHSLHFYLYFQYAGWFSFAALAVLQRHFNLDGQGLILPFMGYMLLYYAFSTWLPTAWWIGLVLLLVQLSWMGYKVCKMERPPPLPPLSALILLSWTIKTLLELLYLLPAVAHWAKHIRVLQIGYLHLYFLGMLRSAVILVWLPDRKSQYGWVAAAVFTLLLLLFGPWLQGWLGYQRHTVLLLWGALCLVLVVLFFFLKRILLWQRHVQRNH